MAAIVVAGATGRFGSVIFEALYEQHRDLEFFVLGRRWRKGLARERVRFYEFDYTQEAALPDFPTLPRLLLDLSGPVAETDGLLMKLSLTASVPYVDMAVHNSHFEQARRIQDEVGGFALIHTGLFPGFSNLMAREVQRRLDASARIQLKSIFPVYAGGGQNVARTAVDLLRESGSHYYIENGRHVSVQMHSDGSRIPFFGEPKKFYRWQLPEIQCLESAFPTENFERWVTIEPSIGNYGFGFAVQLFNVHARISAVLGRLVFGLVYLLKSVVLKNSEPSIRMECSGQAAGKEIQVRLSSDNGVQLHGVIMANCLEKLMERELSDGLYVPEEVFALQDALPVGEFANYRLEIVE